MVSLKRLNGYDDVNCYVKVDMSEYDNSNIAVPCKDGYVVKLMNSHDSKKYRSRIGM